MNILITGASSGIGRELALSYASAGNRVLACGRNEEKLNQMKQQYPNISTLCFDLTDYDDYPIPEQKDWPLDLLILNAGDCEYIDDAVNFDAKRFDKIININLISIAYALQAWLPLMKPGSRLVLVSSSVEMIALPRAEAYGASKAGLSYLGKVLAIDLAKHKIHVTRVHPGFVATPLTDRNTFAMPMIISAESAAEKIIEGIAKGKSDIRFPTLFILILRCLASLPFPLWRRVAQKIGSA